MTALYMNLFSLDLQHMIGFFKSGRCEFEQYVQSALGELLKMSDSAGEKQPWKVEKEYVDNF